MKLLLFIAMVVAALCMTGCLHIIGKALSSSDRGPRVSVEASHNGDVSVNVDADSSYTFGEAGPEIVGSGPSKTEERTVGSFHGVAAGSIVQLTFKTGPTQSVSVEAQADVLPHLQTVVDDGILKIELSGTFRKIGPVKVTVTNPQLDYLEISGAATGAASGIREDSLRLAVSGSGSLDISGEAKKLTTDVSGAAKLTGNLKASERLGGEISGNGNASLKGTFGDTDMQVSGSANLDIDNVQAQSLSLNVSGSGKAHVIGKATTVKVEGEGAANVDLVGLSSETSDVQASGATLVAVNPSNSLTASASGAATVRYLGNPKVQSDTSGAAHVDRGN